ncbi:MAG: hypothetical protein G01um101430_73 [Parcubacteria group bacterium Gr01-1014_30]|nr:MAG: hypothetical protein G01um101430_73 [Parcubacteria group bacterium Gr01-1014_30]
MSRVKNVFKKHRIQPLKRLGQHFLVDKFALFKVISASELKTQNVVLEIGPGTGLLTQELAKRSRKVIAVEKDPKMIDILSETLKGFRNIEVMWGDILKMQSAKLKAKNSNVKFKIVGNLPFYLTAPVIRKFLEAKVQPELMVLVVQKEVAQRICSKPPKMNLLTVAVQFYADPKIVAYIPKTSFWPQPKVDSAILKITPRADKYEADKSFVNKFFRLVKAGFSHPRKQLVNNLSQGLKLNKEETVALLSQNNIKPEQRAETLSLENWRALAKSSITR